MGKSFHIANPNIQDKGLVVSVRFESFHYQLSWKQEEIGIYIINEPYYAIGPSCSSKLFSYLEDFCRIYRQFWWSLVAVRTDFFPTMVFEVLQQDSLGLTGAFASSEFVWLLLAKYWWAIKYHFDFFFVFVDLPILLHMYGHFICKGLSNCI